MRLQTLYLPPVGASDHARFALIADQVDRGEDDAWFQEGVDRLREFARACGASALLVTPDTVELPDVSTDEEPDEEPEVTVTTYAPASPSLSAHVAAAVRTHVETRERRGRPW